MKLFIATPSYGEPCEDFKQSLKATFPVLEAAGYVIEQKVLQGCCYVHTARNKLVRDFLHSGADVLLFLDADLGWKPPDMLRLMQHDVAIVGGAAPFRTGTEGFPVHYLQTPDGYPMGNPETGLLECDVLPTAIMRIKRHVFFDLVASKQAPLRIENARDGSERERYLSFFDFEADNANCVEYGEDVTFCRKWTRVGGQLWCEPNMTIRHHDGGGPDYREGNLDRHLRAPSLAA